jgi:hypothetical protein
MSYPLVLDVEVVLANMIDKVVRIQGMQEGYDDRTVVGSKGHIKQNTASDCLCDIPMSGAFGEIRQQNRTGASAIEMLSAGDLLVNEVRPSRAIGSSIPIK